MNPELLGRIAGQLKAAKTIAILPHLNADGDALGAALALGLALSSTGCSVDVMLEEPVPPTLDFLPGQRLLAEKPREAYSLAVNIDNGDVMRLGERSDIFRHAPIRLSIDHHATNKVEADLSYIDTSAAATGEIVFDLIGLLGVPLDRDIATCLYTAILTDTGGFRFTNTTPRTHEITARLMAYGIDHGLIAKKVFDTISHVKLQLMRLSLDNMRFFEDGRIAVTHIRHEDTRLMQLKTDDFEGLVNIGRNLVGVEVSLFMREERANVWKGSLRSNGCVDVAAVAETVAGGGHKRAAGFNIGGTLEEIVAGLLSAIREQLDACNGTDA